MPKGLPVRLPVDDSPAASNLLFKRFVACINRLGRVCVGFGPGEVGKTSKLTGIESLWVMGDEIVEAGTLKCDQGVLVVALGVGGRSEFRLVFDQQRGQVILPMALRGQVTIHG